MALSDAFRALLRALDGRDHDRFQAAMRGWVAALDASTAADRAALLPELVARVRSADDSQAGGFAALCGGALVERGTAAGPLVDVLLERVPAVAADAKRFGDAVVAERGPVDPDAPRPEPDGPFVVADVPVPSAVVDRIGETDPTAVSAWYALDRWCRPLIAAANADRASLERIVRSDLRDTVVPLMGLHGAVHWVGVLLHLPLREPWTIVHRPTRRAWEAEVDAIAVNFELHTLVAAALAPLLGFDPPKAAILRCLAGEGPQQLDVPSQGAFETLQHDAAADAPGHGVPLAHRVWNEGRPADVPEFEGRRTLLLDPPVIARSWNTCRTFGGFGGSVRLLRELDPAEAGALLDRMAGR
jgi:hypothetical protein